MIRRSRKFENASLNEVEKILNEFIGNLNTIKYYTEEFEKYYKNVKGTSRERDVINRYLAMVWNSDEEFKEFLTFLTDYKNSL